MTGSIFGNRLPRVMAALLAAAARTVGGYGVGGYSPRRRSDPLWVQEELIQKAKAKRARRLQRNIINAKMGGYYG